MEKTIVEQDCTTLLQPDGIVVYEITSTVKDKGELPHINLFLFQIINTLSPTEDVFIRVARPYDLETIATDRQIAVNNKAIYFLTAVMSRRYSTLEVAVQAKDAIRSRIDNAVQAWHDYTTEFKGTTDIYHPTAEASYEQALKDNYVSARNARVVAEADVTASNAAVTFAEDAVTAQQIIVGLYSDEVALCQAKVAYWDDYYTHWGPDCIPGDLHGDLFEAKLAAFCADVEINYNSAVADLATKNQEVASAVTAKEEAEAILASAQTAEDAALAAVLEVCPDFDPRSV
jgi:hypothetical protein